MAATPMQTHITSPTKLDQWMNPAESSIGKSRLDTFYQIFQLQADCCALLQEDRTSSISLGWSCAATFGVSKAVFLPRKVGYRRHCETAAVDEGSRTQRAAGKARPRSSQRGGRRRGTRCCGRP